MTIILFFGLAWSIAMNYALFYRMEKIESKVALVDDAFAHKHNEKLIKAHLQTHLNHIKKDRNLSKRKQLKRKQ